jgi:hypothetical protein
MVVEHTSKLNDQHAGVDQRGKELRVEGQTEEREKTVAGRAPELKCHPHESDLRQLELELAFGRQQKWTNSNLCSYSPWTRMNRRGAAAIPLLTGNAILDDEQKIAQPPNGAPIWEEGCFVIRSLNELKEAEVWRDQAIGLRRVSDLRDELVCVEAGDIFSILNRTCAIPQNSIF